MTPTERKLERRRKAAIIIGGLITLWLMYLAGWME